VGGVFGLQLVIQRGLTVGWAIGLLIAGAAFGSMTKSLLDAASGNELLARVLSAQGTDGVYTTMTQFLAAATTAYVVSVIVRLHRDEESGIGEAVLAGSVSRWAWLLSAVGAALTGATVLLVCAGLGNGLGAGLTLGEPHIIVRLTLAALAFLPAMAVVASVAALAVALRHPGLGWLAVTFVVCALYLGALLRLPRWLIDASPVGRTTAPSSISVVTLALMVAIAAAVTLIAGFIYRRRDVV
jgi:ABC-2 type transport system permease protein